MWCYNGAPGFRLQASLSLKSCPVNGSCKLPMCFSCRPSFPEQQGDVRCDICGGGETVLRPQSPSDHSFWQVSADRLTLGEKTFITTLETSVILTTFWLICCCFFRFKSLLASHGPDGSPNKQIEISDVKYNIFQVTNRLFPDFFFLLNNCSVLFLNETFDLSADNDVIPVLWRNRVAENQRLRPAGGENHNRYRQVDHKIQFLSLTTLSSRLYNIMSRYVVSSTLQTLMCLHVWTNEPVSKIFLTNRRWEQITETSVTPVSKTFVSVFVFFSSCSCCQLPVCSSWGRYKDTVNSSAPTTSTWIMQSASTRQPR